MKSNILAVCIASLLAPAWAHATDDEPIPYSDDPGYRRPRSKAPPPRRQVEESPYELEDRSRSLARRDDPAQGLGAELVGGLMLLDSSRGQQVESRFGWGVRTTWEFGRLFSDDVLHHALMADLGWWYTGISDGTTDVKVDSNYHYFSLAPAYVFRFTEDAVWGVFVQLGGGVSYVSSVLHHGNSEVSASGLKPLFQYGVGLRVFPALTSDGTMRLSGRIELTRFRRGYMDDTFLGASLGLAF